jgi:aspartate/methionine/tyrosine aminotransferase
LSDSSVRAALRGALISPFHAGDIGRRASARARAGREVVGMYFGQPSVGAPPRALAAAHRIIDSDPLGYWESVALKERLAAHYASTYGVDVPASRILLTAGASAGLVAAYATLFRPGDRVATFVPGYPAYRNTLRALGIEAVEIRCSPHDGYRPDARALEALDPAPHGLVLPSPANPTGAMLDAAQMRDFAAVCRAREIKIISDEIYHGISYGGRDVCALECDPLAVVVNSFSKLYRMPGWRLGWLVAPEAWATRLSSCLINMFLTPSTPAQHVALAAMDEREDLDRWVQIYAQNRVRLIAGLQALGLRGIVPPDGAFYVYADIGHITNDSLGFCVRAIEEIGLGLAPGIDFDPERGQGFVRFSFAVYPELIERALELLAGWLPNYARGQAAAT